MGFKILLRAVEQDFITALSAIFEDQPLDLIIPLEIDWSDKSAVEALFKQKSPSVVINYGVSASGVVPDMERACFADIARRCADSLVPLLHVSSYRVFGKTVSDDELAEEMPPKPRDELGKRLLALEQIAQQAPKHLILRLSWILEGGQGSLFDCLIPPLMLKENIYVSDHHFGSPVNISFVARVVLAIVQQTLCGAENWGVFHLHGIDRCSEAEFCDALVRVMSVLLNQSIDMSPVACVGDDRRLMQGNAILTGARCTDNFGIQLPSWRKGLKTLVEAYLLKYDYLVK